MRTKMIPVRWLVTALALAALAGTAMAATQAPDNSHSSAGDAAPAATAQHNDHRGGDHGWHRAWYHRGWHRGWHGGWHRGGPGRAGMLDRPLLGAFRRLDLTADQRRKVRTILMSTRQRSTQRHAQSARAGAAGPAAAGAAQDFAALINPGDPNHAQAVQAAKDRSAQRIQRASQTEQDLYDVLTAQQKTRLTQMFTQMRTRMQRRAAAADAATAPRGPAE